MANVDTRKCNHCKQPIEINRENIRGVVYYKKYYYHTACFCELAERKSQNTRGKPKEWKEALDNVSEYEDEAREIVRQHWGYREAKDNLNDYLLSQYNVISIDTRFWQVVADLNNGMYKNKRCKKVSPQILLEAWKWGQPKLNEANKRNKMNNKGPKDDDQRVSYDLAIIVRKIPEYLAYKAKQEASKTELITKTKRITYADMRRAEIKHEGLGDISDLLDDDD